MRSASSTHSSPMTLIIRTSPSSACDFVQSGDRDAIPNLGWCGALNLKRQRIGNRCYAHMNASHWLLRGICASIMEYPPLTGSWHSY